MPTIIDGVRRYVKRTRGATATALSDDYRRGYLQGLRHHYRVAQTGADDKHAKWHVIPRQSGIR